VLIKDISITAALEADMDEREFATWLSEMHRLSARQRAAALVRLQDLEGAATTFEPEQASSQAEAKVSGKSASRSKRSSSPAALGEIGPAKVESVGCPHCGGGESVGWGRAHDLERYRCKACRRTFNAATKTPVARLRKKERWFSHAAAMIEGVSLAKAADRCGVHPSTAFRWRHRFLSAPALDKPQRLKGIVEIDETFILESFKGRRSDLPRPARKRGGKAKHPGLFFENIPILVARDRAGATIDGVLSEVTAACVAAALQGAVTSTNQIVCDGGVAIRAFARRRAIPMHVVAAPGKPDPAAPDIHINNVNAYHGRLKEWLRRFHGVATKNLPNYLGWRRALEAWGEAVNPKDWLLGALGQGPYQQLTL
jgi:transposase-like protein